ncbi:endonuclease/exonuclease/phosphatase family protein [Streptomyces sp. NPDC050428]|uniref:endonuclease/exonuclease/phosphatase family protein n=1 Tax=Streptomyces sp. NPDC050428 TaxID=3155757 RepID=UPI00343E6660
MRRKRKLAAALTAVAAVIMAGTGAEFRQAAGEGSELVPTAAAATSLKVMDWNIQGGNSSDGDAHWDSIVSTIAAEDPDIVTLQEVHNDTGHVVDGRPGINQYQTLLDTFPEYEGHFARSDTNAYGGSAGQLILSKYPITEKVSYILPNDDSGAVDRSMGGVNVDVGGTAVRIYSTHLSAGDGAAAVTRREAQVRYILGKLPADKMTTPMLFTGDLNVRPDAAIRSWIAGAGWIDTWTQVNANTGADVVTHPGSGDDARIDYVYGSPAIDVSAARTRTTTASDHRPVVSDLTIHSTTVAKSGAVLAGADSLAGSANVSVYSDAAAKLRVCDNKPDGWGVRAYVYGKAGGGLVVTGQDGAYADRCGTFDVASGTTSSPAVKVCLYKSGEEKDCREKTIT